MWNKVVFVAVMILSIAGLFVSAADVSAADVSITATCNVKVTIKATVPDSVEQGKTFSMTNITVQPANTYGFNVTSSVYYLSASNTTSTTYTQNFYATNPSPTTGHNTYVGYYPNWTLDATGPVGSAVAITLIKSYTVIQGYGGSPVTCSFNKTLASVPIVAAAPKPTSQPAPTQTSQPAPSKTVGPSTTKSVTVTPTPANSTPQPTSSPPATEKNLPPSISAQQQAEEESASVVPLNIEVRNSSGKPVEGAEVTLDSTKKLITDKHGRVVFSNVLTGKHAILISYKDHKTNHDILLATADVGQVKNISLPPVSPMANPYVIIAAAAAIASIAIGTGILLIRRRRTKEAASDMPLPSVTIPSILDGTAIPSPAKNAITHIPAIQANHPVTPTITPAPWELPVAPVVPPPDTTAAATRSDAQVQVEQYSTQPTTIHIKQET